MSRRICLFVAALTGIISMMEMPVCASGKASILLRPAYVPINSDTSQSAVLVSLSSYPGDDVRYRLFNGSNQYACWDSQTQTYITSKSYSSGPVATGRPSVYSEFWILYRRGTNKFTSASYRDRLGPGYSTNYKTSALPEAIVIEDSFIISGTLTGTVINTLDQKYVVLAWNKSEFISATSSELKTGVFSLLIPGGTEIDKIEIRTLENLSLAEKSGSWKTFSNLSFISLSDNPLQDANLEFIKIDSSDLEGFEKGKYFYDIELPPATTLIPEISYKTSNSGSTVSIIPATDLEGKAGSRITSIIVTAPDGITVRIYSILFNPLQEVGSISEFLSGDSSGIFLLKTELMISYSNEYRNQKYIQDNGGGILIDDPDGIIKSEYKTGDLISNLKCKLKVYNGNLVLIPGSDPGPAISSGNEILPVICSIALLNSGTSGYQGKLIKIMKVSNPSGVELFTADSAITISDDSGTLQLFTPYSNHDYIGTILPAVFDVIGIVSSDHGFVSVMPRFLSDFTFYNSDASLSGIEINGALIEGFSPEVYSYTCVLPAGTKSLPEITFTANNPGSQVQYLPAVEISGNENERTGTISVTAEDGLSQRNYKILFSVAFYSETSDLPVTEIKVFPVPASEILNISGLNGLNSIKIIDSGGKLLFSEKTSSPVFRVSTDKLESGIYLIRINNQVLKFMKY